MPRLIMALAWIVIAWRWGDWRCWHKYQATILYWMVVNLLQEYLTYNHSLWEFRPSPLFPNHTTVVLLFLTNYVNIALVYLGRFPSKGFWRSIGWVGLWVALFAAIEFGMVSFHYLTYDHGWNYLWSVLTDIAMFSLVRLHHTHPGWAYVLTGLTMVGGLLVFRIPISSMK